MRPTTPIPASEIKKASARLVIGKTVLVVDDHPGISEAIALHLTRLGYRTLIAADGQEARDVISTHGVAKIDLLVTDVEMPRMRGDELAEWFLRENPQARVLMMSTNHNCVKPCSRVAFPQKPFGPDLLGVQVGLLLAPAGALPGLASEPTTDLSLENRLHRAL